MTTRHEEGFFSAKDNLRLFWESDVPDEPRAHIALVHGYADHSGRYRDVMDALAKDGFAVHAFDYRGHGQSGGRRGHVDRFDEYLDDLELQWRRVRQAAGARKTFLLGHSHGGLISILFQRRNPEGLSGLILSAPYLELALKPSPMKVFTSKMVGKVIPWLPVKNEIQPELLTRDPELQRKVMKDHLYNQVVTPRWFTESNRAQAEAFALAPQIKLPTLMFWGSNDGIANPSAARRFIDAVGAKDKTFREYEGMLHEPMNDLGREQVWKDISGWIFAHL
jgi:alpha-beta hydrolase superfamily lysophospholipase